ncbi:piggyBac transposable element-derived protein 2-like isoform X2 [Manduca sexta]|uniref:piggyBac transposable element-derived protein 2-like isoform X2 n=1 Tax=Manduca sexta TaxID=7130 RepID=UPI00188E0995|nr:piggyBac transposable element-derived protein 2-like isoform X2 [Manduca sexta]
MASKQQSVGGTRNLQLTRAHKILALVPAQNACSDDSSTSDEEANAYIPPSPDTSDPPSIASSLEALNLLDTSTDSNNEQHDIPITLPLTPTFDEVFPSPNTSNYNVIPTLNSIQSLPSPFMSPELTYILREEYGILSLGTIRTNRLRGCQELLPTDKQLKKKKRGSSAQVVCNKNKLAVVKWNDNKVVTLISTYIDSYPLETIKRYDKDEKKKVDVECPQVVKHYNKHMGGVDLADMLISLYRTPFKSHRWYLGIFSQLVDMCINNAWLLHRRDGKKTSLKDFRFELFDGLSKSNRIGTNQNVTDDIGENLKIHKPVSVRPTDSVRFDNTGHLPEAGNESIRCKYCKSGRTSVYCIKM